VLGAATGIVLALVAMGAPVVWLASQTWSAANAMWSYATASKSAVTPVPPTGPVGAGTGSGTFLGIPTGAAIASIIGTAVPLAAASAFYQFTPQGQRQISGLLGSIGGPISERSLGGGPGAADKKTKLRMYGIPDDWLPINRPQSQPSSPTAGQPFDYSNVGTMPLTTGTSLTGFNIGAMFFDAIKKVNLGPLKQKFVDIFNQIKTLVPQKINEIVNFIRDLPNKARAVLGGLLGAVTTPIQNALGSAQSIVQGAINTISSTFWGLVGQASSAWQGVYNAVSGPIDWIIGKINQLLNLVGGGASVGMRTGATAFAAGSPELAAGAPNLNAAGAPGGMFGGVGYITNAILSFVNGISNDLFGAGPGDAWNAFMGTANRIFGRMGYRFYYNDVYSDQQTFGQGWGNCVDLSQALIALANIFGFGGGLQTGFWGAYPHDWAVINGVALDPTSFTHGMGWAPPPQTPAQSLGTHLGVGRAGPGSGTTIIINGDIYGYNDFKKKVGTAYHEIRRGY
jgi:hypothetical protein